MSLFAEIAKSCRPTPNFPKGGPEPLRMYTFKKNIGDKPEEMETVIATSLGAAIQKAPEMLTWFLHSVSK